MPSLDDLVINILERVYPGYHVWLSDQRWWYATWRGPTWQFDESRQPSTVYGRNPAELSNELAAEEASRMRRILARPLGQFSGERDDGCLHRADNPGTPGRAVINRYR